MTTRYFRKKDGFSGEVSFVLPKDILQMSARHPLIHTLYNTDIGYYPHARNHFRERPSGAEENIVIFCTAGKGWIDTEGSHIVIGQNEAIIVPNGTAHTYGADETDPWTIYWGHFKGESAQYFIRRLEASDELIGVSERARQRVLNTFNAMFATLQGGYTMESVISTALGFAEVLGTLVFANEDFHPDLESAANRRIDMTIQYMLSRVESTVTLREIASKACLSATRYIQLFKVKTGYSPIEYFTRLKIQRACHYLDATNMKVYAISQKLSYSDPYYFSRVFHKVMGVSPRMYRDRSSPTLSEPSIRMSSHVQSE